MTIELPHHLLDTLNNILEFHLCNLQLEEDSENKELALYETKEVWDVVWKALREIESGVNNG